MALQLLNYVTMPFKYSIRHFRQQAQSTNNGGSIGGGGGGGGGSWIQF